MKPDKTTHFGYRDVAAGDKAGLVDDVFTSVADNYDIMNDLMSMGVHRLWKRHFISTCRVREGNRVLDLAGGTADIAVQLSRRVGDKGQVVLSDINAAMLRHGRDRLLDEGAYGCSSIAQADAQYLPFREGYFDLVTIAFGLRNVTDQMLALEEMARVLRPGGRIAILEFSQVKPALLKRLYDRYSFSVLPRLGELVAKDADSYRYLAESIRRHPDQDTLRDMVQDAGLVQARYRNLSGGIVAIHTGVKA